MLKGGRYADGVHEFLRVFALQHGDEYQVTENQVGRITRCRKGDGVLIVPIDAGGQTARIVIEMTDSDEIRPWNDYLEIAERNRKATASLGLVPGLDQMHGDGPLRAIGPKRLLLAFNPLRDEPTMLKVSIQLLRVQATLALNRTTGQHVRTAEEKLNDATAHLQKLTEVQKTAGAIRKGAEKIDLDCAGLHTTVQRLLAEALTALDSAEAAAA